MGRGVGVGGGSRVGVGVGVGVGVLVGEVVSMEVIVEVGLGVHMGVDLGGKIDKGGMGWEGEDLGYGREWQRKEDCRGELGESQSISGKTRGCGSCGLQQKAAAGAGTAAAIAANSSLFAQQQW